jgi:hypothetical protein
MMHSDESSKVNNSRNHWNSFILSHPSLKFFYGASINEIVSNRDPLYLSLLRWERMTRHCSFQPYSMLYQSLAFYFSAAPLATKYNKHIYCPYYIATLYHTILAFIIIQTLHKLLSWVLSHFVASHCLCVACIKIVLLVISSITFCGSHNMVANNFNSYHKIDYIALYSYGFYVIINSTNIYINVENVIKRGYK